MSKEKIYNYIFCDLEDDPEKEIGAQHNVKVRLNCKDDHHFLDMLFGILHAWVESNHKPNADQVEVLGDKQ